MVPTFFDISFTSAFTSAVERASSFASVARFKPLSFFTSTSVAITFAPSATKACAIARPIPCPAAVTHVLDAFVLVSVPPVPRNVRGQRLAGIEAYAGEPNRPRTRLREGEQHIADAAPLRGW